MKLPLIRPAQPSDLIPLIQFSEEAGYGITSLPRNPLVLEKKIHASESAFQEKLVIPTHETYQFCLEWEERVIGTSGIVSRIGMTEPFFAYQLAYEPQVCISLGIDRRIGVLHFTRARKKPTEIGSLFLEEPFRRNEFGKLLSFSRFLFIATFKNRFAPTVIAELRGINNEGISPFWEAVGRPFFHTDFPKADLLRSEHHGYIEELFPKHPLYVDLLPQPAQKAIGNTHPETTAARKLLERQGFKISHYLDLFDAGPHLFAPTEEIHAIKTSVVSTVTALSSEKIHTTRAFLSNTRLDFRATYAPISIGEEGLSFHPAVAETLHVDVGSPIRYYI